MTPTTHCYAILGLTYLSVLAINLFVDLFTMLPIRIIVGKNVIYILPVVYTVAWNLL